MFEIKPAKRYNLPKMLMDIRKKLDGIEKVLGDAQFSFNAFSILVKKAKEAHQAQCDEKPNSPMSRMFKRAKERLKLYPIDELSDSELSGLTYGEAIAKLDELSNLIDTNVESKRKLYRAVKRLKNMYEAAQVLDTVRKDSDVVTVKVNVNPSQRKPWEELREILEADNNRVHELQELDLAICMVIETTKLYPADHEKYPLNRLIRQDMYWHFVADDDQEVDRFWYHDTTGHGNFDDFVVVDRDKSYELIHQSKHDYLDTMYTWYVSHLAEIVMQ